jgi:hypothetical protein
MQPYSGVGYDPIVYTMITPVVTVDATGGHVEVDANQKFMTNIPIDRGIAITEVDWNYATNTMETFDKGAISHWNQVTQITESLARTKIATDPLNIDYDNWERFTRILEVTAVGECVISYTPKVIERRVLRHPWLTIAQQLNIVSSIFPALDQSSTVAGPKMQVWAKLYFQMLNLTPDLRSYLATRIQISSQT